MCWLFNGRNFEGARAEEEEVEPDEEAEAEEAGPEEDESEPFCVSMSIHVDVRQIQGDVGIEYACMHPPVIFA